MILYDGCSTCSITSGFSVSPTQTGTPSIACTMSPGRTPALSAGLSSTTSVMKNGGRAAGSIRRPADPGRPDDAGPHRPALGLRLGHLVVRVVVAQLRDHPLDRRPQRHRIALAERPGRGGPVGGAVAGQRGKLESGDVGPALLQVAGVGGESVLQQVLAAQAGAAVVVGEDAEVRLPQRVDGRRRGAGRAAARWGGRRRAG